jgi:hypothetical protein
MMLIFGFTLDPHLMSGYIGQLAKQHHKTLLVLLALMRARSTGLETVIDVSPRNPP